MTYDDAKVLFFPDEDQEVTRGEQVEAMQNLIDCGAVWRLEGHVGRTAMDFIEQGHCTLGEQCFRDYYGNYIPSKHEVEPGTKGSPEYVEERSGA